MHLASIILPNADNSGVSLADVHAAMQATIVDVFGGFTSLAVSGAWRADDGTIYAEQGTKYEIAMDATPSNAKKLESIARFYGHMSQQIAMCVQFADGAIAFLDVMPAAESVLA